MVPYAASVKCFNLFKVSRKRRIVKFYVFLFSFHHRKELEKGFGEALCCSLLIHRKQLIKNVVVRQTHRESKHVHTLGGLGRPHQQRNIFDIAKKANARVVPEATVQLSTRAMPSTKSLIKFYVSFRLTWNARLFSLTLATDAGSNPYRISTSCHIKNIQHLQHSTLNSTLRSFAVRGSDMLCALGMATVSRFSFERSFRFSHNNKLCVIMRPIFCIIDPHDFYQSLSSMKISTVKFLWL